MKAVLLWSILIAAYAGAQEDPGAVLEKCCAITAKDVTLLNRGQAIGRLIDFGDDTDLAIMGAVRLTVPKEAYIDWYRHVENYKFSSMVKEAVQFHVPPQPEDLARLALDMNQFKLLKDCMPGKCGFKLSNEEIARSRAELDWKAPSVSAKAEALAKSILLQHVALYMKQGDAALPTYNDKPEARNVLVT